MTTTNTTSEPTWDPPDGGVWELEDAHGPGVGSVAMRAEMEEGFAQGFRNSFTRLGLPLSHIEVRHINDWQYTSVFVHEAPRSAGKPPPDIILKALTRLHPKSRARTKVAANACANRVAQGFAQEWVASRETWINRILDHQRVDPTTLDDDALAAHLQAGVRLGQEAFMRHFELVAGAIPLGEWFVRTEQWGLSPAEARQAVMYGTPVHHESAERLERLRGTLGDSVPESLDEIRNVSASAAAALDDYLDYHGYWLTEDRLAGPLLTDFPAVILQSIKAGHPPTDTPPVETQVAALREQVPAEDREEFDQLAADAHEAYKMLDDNSGILGAWACGVAARDLRCAADRLVETGKMRHAEHVWTLTASQIIELLRGANTPSPTDIEAAYGQWQENAKLKPPRHLNGTPSPPPDPSVFPAPVRRLVAAVGAFLNDKFNAEGSTIGIGNKEVTGRAVVVDAPSDALERIQPGDILVTTATTPAYNAILGIVGGIIVSTGGPSSHAAVVAREMGTPAIVGYPNATTAITDGATITLDPATATVTTHHS